MHDLIRTSFQRGVRGNAFEERAASCRISLSSFLAFITRISMNGVDDEAAINSPRIAALIHADN